VRLGKQGHDARWQAAVAAYLVVIADEVRRSERAGKRAC
jgi:hypothetical protein